MTESSPAGRSAGDQSRDRSRDELLGELRWKKFPVLDDGFVCLVDVMGDDGSVVQAARVSYGEGTKRVSDDRTLIRYLMRHRHSTPFEMAEIKFLVRVPMDCWRQWIRHRTACLAGDTRLSFDLPGAERRGVRRHHSVTIEDFHRMWHTEPRRARLRKMRLRMCDEQTGEIRHTHVTDIWRTGTRPVFQVTLENGYQLKMTREHRCLTAAGWMTLQEATSLRLRDDGGCTWDGDAPAMAVNGVLACQESDQRIDERKPPVRRLMRAYSRIVKIEYAGEEPTYDLSVAGPYHNFVANGFIVHNSVNEYSTRYSLAIDAAQATGAGEWRMQAATNRQGSRGALPADVGEPLSVAERELQERARAVYQQRIDAGVAREQARKDLPLSTYTEAYWKIDLHNLLHFLSLRMDSHAQEEIRAYATTIGEQIVRPLFPLVWEAFEDYRLGGMFLTRLDQGVIARLASAAAERGLNPPFDDALFLTCQDDSWRDLTRSREREECREKLARLGLLRAE
jgi:thymidylate synthase ThyX